MTFDPDNLLESMLESLDSIRKIDVGDIPDIELYMDQVLTFMDRNLAGSKRHEEDKILTKTMINNYAKNALLPPPERKKYSRRHLVILLFVYYLKNILSISDIRKLLNPLTESYFHGEKNLSVEEVYEEVFRHSGERLEDMKDFIEEQFRFSEETRALAADRGGDEADQDYLQFFSFISSLCFDVYIKRFMIEKLIDLMPEPEPKKKHRR